MSKIDVRLADWNSDSQDIIHVRKEVFVKEQNVPPELEQDGRDPELIHVLARSGSEATGTARMTRDGHIGRVAVLKAMRGKGVGVLMMKALEEEARELKIPEVHLNAQLSAKGFYTALGYKEEGEIFEEAGISHVHMRKKVSISPENIDSK
ncbi:MAG: GNAT family N-acetyltransferase [Spirochaetales bacterium]|nr:GNAT family N-acetyltransferase [Spirochaetales bacterium]